MLTIVPLLKRRLTGELPYSDRLGHNINRCPQCKVTYTRSITQNPMIPLWLDGALEKAVQTNYRLRYNTYCEFYYDPSHPNALFMKRNSPLIESTPAAFWKTTSAGLFLINIICFYFLLS